MDLSAVSVIEDEMRENETDAAVADDEDEGSEQDLSVPVGKRENWGGEVEAECHRFVPTFLNILI